MFMVPILQDKKRQSLFWVLWGRLSKEDQFIYLNGFGLNGLGLVSYDFRIERFCDF